MTEPAADRIRRVVSDNDGVSGLRVGLKDGGCSGFSYIVEFQSEPGETDVIVEESGARLFVARTDLPHLAGTVVDWKEDEFTSSFSLNNPNASRFCGCGESFSVVAADAD